MKHIKQYVSCKQYKYGKESIYYKDFVIFS